MIVTINGITFNDVFSFRHLGCEIGITFNKDYKYSNKEIQSKFKKAGVKSGYIYISKWDHYVPINGKYIEEQSYEMLCGETRIVALIPDNIKFEVECSM